MRVKSYPVALTTPFEFSGTCHTKDNAVADSVEQLSQLFKELQENFACTGTLEGWEAFVRHWLALPEQLRQLFYTGALAQRHFLEDERLTSRRHFCNFSKAAFVSAMISLRSSLLILSSSSNSRGYAASSIGLASSVRPKPRNAIA